MTRIAALSLVLICALGSLAPAQDSQPTSKPTKVVKLDPRIVLDALATLDEKPVTPSGIQYFLYERLNFFRFRLDSKHKIGQKKLDKFIAKMDRFWKKQDPEDAQKPDFSLTVRQETKYDASKFYGEAQAHNYKGKIKAELKDGAGVVLLTIEFSLSWGRLISSGLSKLQVQGRYDQMIHTAVALGVLNHSAIKDKILAKYKPALAKWSKEQKASLLKVLEGSTATLKEGEMAKFVRGVKVDEPAK